MPIRGSPKYTPTFERTHTHSGRIGTACLSFNLSNSEDPPNAEPKLGNLPERFSSCCSLWCARLAPPQRRRRSAAAASPHRAPTARLKKPIVNHDWLLTSNTSSLRSKPRDFARREQALLRAKCRRRPRPARACPVRPPRAGTPPLHRCRPCCLEMHASTRAQNPCAKLLLAQLLPAADAPARRAVVAAVAGVGAGTRPLPPQPAVRSVDDGLAMGEAKYGRCDYSD